MIIPFGEFSADRPVTGLQGASIAKNCLPVSSSSYGPMPALASFSDALTARCQGGISVRDSENNVHTFAGDATKLYKLNTDGSWEDVSKVGNYTTAAEERWQFVFMHPDRVVATNFTDAIQTYVIGSSTDFADLSAGAPKCRYLAVVKNILVAFNTWDATDGYHPDRAWWADATDPTNWPTPGTSAAAAVQSDFQEIQQGGGINGAVGAVGGNDGMVWLDDAVYRMNYSPGVVFDFKHIEEGRGTTIPGSIANIGSLGAFYVAEDGPYLQTGVQSIPIGFQQVDDFLLEGLDQQYIPRVWSAVDPKRKIWFLAFPTASSPDGNPDRLLCYHWQLKRWSFVEQSLEILLQGYTEGFTLEELDQFGTLETLPFSLDSSAWQGGRASLGGFTTAHKFGFFDGDSLEATLETGEFIDPDGKRLLVTGIKAVTDAPNYTACVGHREAQSDTVAYTAETSPAIDQFCKQRVGTSYPRAHVKIAAAQVWQDAQGIIPRMQVLGER